MDIKLIESETHTRFTRWYAFHREKVLRGWPGENWESVVKRFIHEFNVSIARVYKHAGIQSEHDTMIMFQYVKDIR